MLAKFHCCLTVVPATIGSDQHPGAAREVVLEVVRLRTKGVNEMTDGREAGIETEEGRGPGAGTKGALGPGTGSG